jgi:hypothetical protein
MKDCFRSHKWPLFHQHSRGRLCHTILAITANLLIRKIWDEKVNGFWVGVCQDVPFRTQASAKNPIDCRIYFADNPR